MKNKTEIMKSVNGMASKTVMKLKKHSPEILVVAGIAGTVVSAVAVGVKLDADAALFAADGRAGLVHNSNAVFAVAGVDNQMSVVVKAGGSLRQIGTVG